MRECSLEHPERVQKPWHRCLGQKANRRWRTAAPAISVPAPTKTRIYHTVEEADFEQVAYLRAEAYYESHQGRFTAAYIDQFARAEVQSLRQRTAPQPPGSVAQCFCVAAQRPDSDRIVGTADLLPPAACTSVKLPQIPEDDTSGAYILNLVISKAFRGQGLGKDMTMHLMQLAKSLEAERVYAEVDSTNLAAVKLYLSLGFCESEEGACMVSVPVAPHRKLLMKEL